MQNRDYWKKRFIAIENQNTNKTAKYYAEIEKQFTLANKKIDAEISTWYRRFAKNNEISLTEAKRLLNSNELKEFKWTVQDYIKYGEENAVNQKWLKELENASARKHITRLEALKLQAQQQIEVLYDNQLDGFDALAKKIYSDSYYHTAFEIQKGFNIGYDLQQFSNDQLEKLINNSWGNDNSNFSSRIWKHKTDLVNTLYAELTQCIIKGESPDKAINNISKRFNVAKNKAGRLVMTESAYVSSLSQKNCYKDLDVERYEIVATLDSHTSTICQDMDGKIFKLSDYESGITAPPLHPYCRSCTAPYFDDNYGERIARDENGNKYFVPSDMKYHDWYKKFVEHENKDNLVTLDNFKDVLLNKIGFKTVDDSINKVDDEVKLAVVNELSKLDDKFNCIKNSICDIKVVNTKSVAYNGVSMTDYRKNSLCLSRELYSNKTKLIEYRKNAYKTNWCMPLDIDNDLECMIYNINHEYAHILQNSLIQKEFVKNGWDASEPLKFVDWSKKTLNAKIKWYNSIVRKVQKQCKNEILDIAIKNNPNFDITQNISGYGNTLDSEFFAEVFANSQLSKPNELGLAMNQWLKEKGF